jgi:hypothetical protein
MCKEISDPVTMYSLTITEFAGRESLARLLFTEKPFDPPRRKVFMFVDGIENRLLSTLLIIGSPAFVV